MNAFIKQCRGWWFTPVDGASLSVFRIALGVTVIATAVDRFSLVNGWTSIFFGLLVLTGAALALGYRSRWASLVASFGVSVLGLNQHEDLIFLAILLFACAWVSLDHFFAVQHSRSKTGEKTVRQVELFLILGLFGFAYFFGAIEKIDSDWFSGRELQSALEAVRGQSAFAIVLLEGALLKIAAWSVFFVELLAPLGLIWRRSRIPTVLVLCLFHLLTYALFPADPFPFFMLCAVPLYFPPAWPRRAMALHQGHLDESNQVESAVAWVRTFGGVSLLIFLVGGSVALAIGSQASLKDPKSLFSWRPRAESETCEFHYVIERAGGDRSIASPMHLSSAQFVELLRRPALVRAYAQTHLCEPGVRIFSSRRCGQGRGGRVEGLSDVDLCDPTRSDWSFGS